MAWLAFFFTALDEDCGRLNDCPVPPYETQLAAAALTALALVLAFLWLRRWIARGRSSTPFSE